MKKQEGGYVLVLVLVTMAALAVLSLAAIQVNLATNKLTVIRTEDTQLNEDAKSALQLISKNVRDTFPVHELNEIPNHMKSEKAFDDRLSTLLKTNQTLALPESTNEIVYSIRLKQDNLKNPLETAPFTKILQVDVTATRPVRPDQPNLSVTYTQDLYLTALPSFLYYVLGSDSTLTVNGMPKIKGNIYSGDTLTFNENANYQLNNEKKSISNLENSYLYLDGRIDLMELTDCSICTQQTFFVTKGKKLAGEKADVSVSPSQFSAFQYDYSIIEYLNRHLDDEKQLPFSNEVKTTIFEKASIPSTENVFEVERIIPKDGTSIIESVTPYLNAERYNQFKDATILKLPNDLKNRAMYITESITKQTTPLLFDGDVVIESIDNLKIERPLIIKGNLTIRGNVSFSSTVYALGDSYIDRANILPIDNKEENSLILMSKGKILLNRINEFDDSATTLQAFLYSDSGIEPKDNLTRVYAVGSTIEINGGMYSRGPLELNVFRGTFSGANESSAIEQFSNPLPSPDVDQSRLKLTYNDSVLKQLNTLPVTNKLQFFVSHPIQTK